MRLYYRAALARAQEVEAAPIDDSAAEPKPEDFYAVADQMELVQNEKGGRIVSEDIPTLLRDIGREIRDLSEAEAFTFDERRRLVYKRRRREAVKNASIYVGRFVFFTSLFVAITPGVSLSTLANIATIVGLIETSVPGSIMSIYEKLRQSFPILPRLPKSKK